MNTLKEVRSYAVSRTLFQAESLRGALEKFGFVQADPIRAPARAQDLILRHRVLDYRAHDLERQYPELNLVEDMLHVYGFLPRERALLLHPRPRHAPWHVEREHPHLRRVLLRLLRQRGPSHLRELEEQIGRVSVVNGWGGSSSASTRMLEALHREGRLEVVRREGGTKVYGLAAPRTRAAPPASRARGLVRLAVHLYAPLSQAMLGQILYGFSRRAPSGTDLRELVAPLLKSGELASSIVEGTRYIWPAEESTCALPDQGVRFLAPFDPIVWDRRRFEHLWQWDYRFEAYTPEPKRRFGYYALPMLWRDEVIGWVNVAPGPEGRRVARPSVTAGFVGRRPRDPEFRREFDAEVERMRIFLTPRE